MRSMDKGIATDCIYLDSTYKIEWVFVLSGIYAYLDMHFRFACLPLKELDEIICHMYVILGD